MLSILIPAYNEAPSIKQTIEQVQAVMQQSSTVYEIIVINDGSTDETVAQVEGTGARLISHPSNGGYGRALKTGMRNAQYDWIAIVDADATYPLNRLPDLLSYIPRFDMVVGARKGVNYWGSSAKRVQRLILGQLITFVVGEKIPDINSGFRIFRKDIALSHIRQISSGFSFTTTLTLAMFLDEHFVCYIPVEYHKRVGKSKVKMGRDTLRMLQILVMAILYYNPLKLFLFLCILDFVIGLIMALVGLLFNSAVTSFYFFGLTLLVALIISALGFVAEVSRGHRLR